MILAFELSMPGIGSWNKKWSGEGRYYAMVKNMGRSQKAKAQGHDIIANQPYNHSWDDGWRARIDVRQVDAQEARKIRRDTKGFCGYDWMVENIMLCGSIKRPEEKQ